MRIIEIKNLTWSLSMDYGEDGWIEGANKLSFKKTFRRGEVLERIQMITVHDGRGNDYAGVVPILFCNRVSFKNSNFNVSQNALISFPETQSRATDILISSSSPVVELGLVARDFKESNVIIYGWSEPNYGLAPAMVYNQLIFTYNLTEDKEK